MRIIISPAKKIITNTNFEYEQLPEFIDDTEVLLSYLKTLTYEQLKSVWNCSDKIATSNYELIHKLDLHSQLTPALFSFKGIQYQYMAPEVLEKKDLEYINKHLRILSGFYGMLRPFDGIVPHRLEMQSKLGSNNLNSLYKYWDSKFADKLLSESNCIINLASKEYSKCVSKYLGKNTRFITCVFGELIGNKVVEKGTLVKMARGEMVRFMAENQIKDVEELKKFNRLNYIFEHHLSNEDTYVFIKKSK